MGRGFVACGLGVGVLVAFAAPAGCGSEADPAQPPGGSGAGGSAGADASGDGAQDAAGSGGSEAAALCGGVQCLPGESCVKDACVCPGNPCSKACCAASQVCYQQQCVVPGASCTQTAQCDDDEYCEQTILKCLPTAGLATCEYKPPPGVFSPELFWSWPSAATPEPEYFQIISTPVVIALQGAGSEGDLLVPAIVFLAGTSIQNAHLRAVRGDNGHDIFHNKTEAFAGQSHLAAGDLDGDGEIEIVGLLEGTSSYCGYVGLHEGAHLAAFDATGAKKWQSAEAVHAGAGAPALADLDGDGEVEIVVGDSVFDAAGKRLWVAQHGPGIDGCLQAAAINVVADVTGDARAEVLIGATAYDASGAVLWRGHEGSTLMHDGFPSVADLDGDGLPEVVVVHGGAQGLSILNGATGERICSGVGSGTSGIGGGPPVIADFDGDQVPEIGVAYAMVYTAYEPDCSVKWSIPVQDQSGMTSSSVFDFDGDGQSELVYTDENLLRVASGLNGNTLFTLQHKSQTGLENPVVADIDADGHTEIVAVGQQSPSLQAFRDIARNWVGSRRVWNQHAYHVTNIEEDGTIPSIEPKSWLAKHVNSYRANVQAEGTFDVPNLQLNDLVFSTASCPSSLEARARVFNVGARGVLAPITVRFTLRLQGAVVSTVDTMTTHTLLPGESEQVTAKLSLQAGVLSGYQLEAEVDPDAGSGFGLVRECTETDNVAGPIAAACPPGPK